MSKEVTCYEAISELDVALHDSLPMGMDYLVLGGIASAALRHPETQIDTTAESGGFVWAAAESGESTIRDNGTKRDVDVLITGVLDDGTAEKLKQVIGEATDDRLVVSVFGFDEHRPEPSKGARVKSAVADWISRRTIDEEGTLRYELHPLEQIVAPETYQPWLLMTPQKRSVQVLNPAGHMLAYRMRSISGLRVKDAEKVSAMTRNVMAVPGLREAVYEGPFLDWLAFAEAITHVQAGRIDATDGMLRPGTSRAEMAAFRWKGKFLHILESNEHLVKLAQDGPVQKLLNLFVRAK